MIYVISALSVMIALIAIAIAMRAKKISNEALKRNEKINSLLENRPEKTKY